MIDKYKILVVDDELPVCKSIAAALESDNYVIDTAYSGEEALQKNEETNYDVVIADLMMLGISGLELLKILKEKKPDIAVIMVTGYPSIRTAVESIKLGAFDYVAKPFTPNEIRTLVSRALSWKYMSEEVKETESKIIIPSGIYTIPGNSWARVEDDGNVRVGAHHALVQQIKLITNIELPQINEMRYQGEACCRIFDSKNHMHRLWTPISGKVIDVNDKILKNLYIIVRQPYTDGWLALITPTRLQDDLKNLTPLE